jgi:hypothetical protein
VKHFLAKQCRKLINGKCWRCILWSMFVGVHFSMHTFVFVLYGCICWCLFFGGSFGLGYFGLTFLGKNVGHIFSMGIFCWICLR